MLTPRWRKVVRDLWTNKSRTILVVLSIAIGVTAIGMVLGSQAIIEEDLPKAFQEINPSSATIFALSSFDQDVIDIIEAMDEVDEAEGRRAINIRFQTKEGEWRNLQLFALSDFDEIKLNKLTPEEGDWPPPAGTILIERSAFTPGLGFGEFEFGDDLIVEPPNGREGSLTIVGTAHDLNQFPPQFSQTPYGYVSFDTLELLGEEKLFNLLSYTVAENKDDFEHIKQITTVVEDRLTQSGVNVIFSLSFQPGEHPVQFFLDAMSYLLIILGVLSVFLGGFLIINTLSAILTQQVRQIGIMKSIGARTPQLTTMYYVLVLLFGLISVAVAIPLGMLGAGFLTSVFGGLLNFDVARFAFDLRVALIQLSVALVIPLLAATWPIIKGTLTTVREAISDHGVGRGQFGTSGLDLFIVGLRRFVPMERPTQISLRNTFRRKGRLAITLLTLSLASAIFISILSIRSSLQQTLDESLSFFNYDVQVQFSRPYRSERLINEALRVDGVENAEIWGFNSARRVRPDGSESDNIIVYAPPANSEMIQPIIIEGRWIRPEDTNAIVINNEVLRSEEDLGIGSTITLKVNGREKEWVVVGIARAAFPQANFYSHYDYFSRAVNEVDLGQVIIIETETGFTQPEVGTALENRYRDNGFQVEQMQTIEEIRSLLTLFFNVIIVVLLLMAILLGIVGGLGLMGTMSINVIERLREIGVMRAIGASDRSVLGIVIVEGAIIGILSWFIGSIIAYPISRAATFFVGTLFLRAAPTFIFSYTGMFAWLGIVILLAIISSFLPARSASRVTVREVLSYE